MIGYIALGICFFIFGYQYAVRRKREQISDFMLLKGGINEVAIGRKINMTDYRAWKRYFDNEQKKEAAIAESRRKFERACLKDSTK